MFFSPDPAASTSFSGTYTYGSANPLKYIDITGLFSWDEALNNVQNVSGIVSDVAGVVAIVALATGVGAPIAAIAGGISIAAGAVHAGTKAVQAYNTCNGGKGSCGDAVAEALMSTVAIVPGGRLIKGAASGIKALEGAGKAANALPSGASESGGRIFVTTGRGTTYDMPSGWTQRMADNNKGLVFQRPGSSGNQNSIRIMEPTSKYPSGYVRVYNSYGNGQPVDPFGKPGPNAATHIPQNYSGAWPAWPIQ
jgi:hypothetical protein